MPTYAYACTECGHQFDAVQSFTDDALTACPECDGRLRKQYGAVGVVFKGGGFYKTDSRAGASPNGSSDSSSSDSSSGDSSPKESSGDSSSKGAESSSSNGSSTSSSTSAASSTTT